MSRITVFLLKLIVTAIKGQEALGSQEEKKIFHVMKSPSQLMFLRE